jgi:hypothetical protein
MVQILGPSPLYPPSLGWSQQQIAQQPPFPPPNDPTNLGSGGYGLGPYGYPPRQDGYPGPPATEERTIIIEHDREPSHGIDFTGIGTAVFIAVASGFILAYLNKRFIKSDKAE